MKRSILAFVLNFILMVSLNSALVPGTKFSGIIEKINKKSSYVLIKKIKFYYPARFKKILEKYYKSKVTIVFSYIKKDGKKFIVYIKENIKVGGRM